MLNGIFRRSRPAVLSLEQVVPEPGLGQLFVVNVPTDLLFACTWAAVGLIASISLAVAFPLADPLGTLLAFG